MMLGAALLACAAIVIALIILIARKAAGQNRAEKLYRTGNLRKSIAIMRRLVDADPTNASARWFLVNLLDHRGDAAGVVETSEPFFTEMPIEGRPPLPAEAGLEDLARIAVKAYWALGRTRDAHDLMRRIQPRGTSVVASDAPADPSADPSAETVRSESAATLLADTATSAPTAAPPDAAISGGGGTASNPGAAPPDAAATTDRELRRLLARTAERCGETAEAIALYGELERSANLDPSGRFHYGLLLARTGRADAALEPLRAAHAALPDRNDIALALADALHTCGIHHEAWALYRMLFESAEGRDRIRIGWAYTETLEGVGNSRGAVDVFREMSRLPEARSEEAAEMLVRAGDLCERMKNDDEAQALWREALERHPDFGAACRRLGLPEKPKDSDDLRAHVRRMPPENFRKLFERIFTEWGYTIDRSAAPDRDSLHFVVARYEDGKDRRKLVHVKRWENETGQLAVQDLKIEVLDRKYDAGVFITMSHFTPSAIKFARRDSRLELFSAAELYPLIQHIEYPR